ncbi:hypothetical protein [Micromonospora halophytica]|uniref:Uncharacterized protein n=1 Tax=Micromonospora halophytica TaxID=47864 RepID=A0A1C5HHG7_9ACTN|nr:hypothetical protein [Micromonospora halophytica]SCG44981.1 hypothetical protein GA0070560_104128 [Micromonospora halophytica]
MDGGRDGERLAASLGRHLARLTFVDLTTDAVTARIIGSVLDWASGQGWRVYRRAPSVLPLPPPLSHQRSVLDVACARPDGPPVVVEVDHTDRRRTWDKLAAEAAAGRVAVWVRWGPGRHAVPPPPIHLVTCHVDRRNGPAGRLHTRTPQPHRPPPEHSPQGAGSAAVVRLPLPALDDPTP